MNRSTAHTELVLDILEAVGNRPDVRVWKQQVGGARMPGRFVRFGLPGQADISGILRGGRRLEIEVKTGRGRPNARQRTFGEVINRFGGLYLVAHSVEEAVAAVDRALEDVRHG